jgi:hypothetical protein
MTSAVVLLVLALVGVFVALFRHLPVALILVTAGRGSAVGADLPPSGWRPIRHGGGSLTHRRSPPSSEAGEPASPSAPARWLVAVDHLPPARWGAAAERGDGGAALDVGAVTGIEQVAAGLVDTLVGTATR